MIITNNFSNIISNTHIANSFQNVSWEENLKILGEMAYAEYNQDFKTISELTDQLFPHFRQRLEHYISNLGFLSKSIILQVQTEVCVEVLLESIRKDDAKRTSELLEQLVYIHPRNSELYQLLWEICGQPNFDQWGKQAFHGRAGCFASISDKEKAICKFKVFLQESWERDLLTSRPTPVSLEKEFENQGVFEIDLDKDCGFADYIDPNEGNPQNIIPHLLDAQKKPGIPVCTGTERLFFLLLFSDIATCQGMVGIDINPKVKAYVDFNVALLRISKTVQEYAELSSSFRRKSEILLNERINTIKSKIETSSLDAKIKKYYLDNIHRFGKIYLTAFQDWRNDLASAGEFQYCRYDQDKQLFLKLKHYADSGNIICFVRSIDDLSFLKNRKITVIDTSNIYYYRCLDFKGKGDFRPRIIWTLQSQINTKYFSYIFKSLSEKERIEFDELLNKVKSSGVKTEEMHKFLVTHLNSVNHLVDHEIGNNHIHPLNSNNCAFYSVENLNALRVYIDNNFFHVPRLGFVDMDDCYSIEKLNTLSIEEIDELCRDPKIQRFVEPLTYTPILDLHIYLAFSKIKGWKEAFEAKFCKRHNDLPGFLNRLKEHHLFEKFVLDFGQERLDLLLSSIG